jgi:uncharacterized Zn finger protein (UPF0148 family)
MASLSDISAMLLAGHRMTTAGCGDCGGPLLAPPGGGAPACARCAASAAAAASDVAPAMRARGLGADGATALPPPTRDPSSAMGDLLLAGWTMLADTCPACARMPLMRDKRCGRGDYCCACRAFAGGAGGDEGAGRSGAPTPAPASPAPAPAPRAVAASADGSPKADAAAFGGWGPAATTGAAVSLPGPASAVLHDATTALLTRLSSATATLAGAGADAPALAGAHAACIADCARALAALRGLVEG